jgi:periplasmic divalent cation tolerance protein
MTDALVVLCTAPDPDRAGALARTLVEERLAACVNIIGPVRSIYSWQGQLCDEAEVLCVIKTDGEHFEALRTRLVALHPYEVPEVIALPVEKGHPPYLEWLAGSLGR